MLCVAGSSAAISGFQSMAIATANRKLWLGRITIVGIANQVATTAVTILLAWIFSSVWALVAGSVIGVLVGTILGHIALPWHRHAFHIERKALGSLYRFGRWIFLTTIVSYVGGKGIQAIQGALVPVQTLGYLSIAGMFASAMVDLSSRFSSSVAFPKLSMTSREQWQQFRRTLNRLRIRILILILPVFVGLSLFALPLINLLYDSRYAEAGPYLAIMAIDSAIRIVPMLYGSGFAAMGNARMLFLLSGTSMVLRITGLSAGYYFGYVQGMLIGTAVGNLCAYAIAAVAARRSQMLSPWTDILAVGFIAVGGCATYFLNF